MGIKIVGKSRQIRPRKLTCKNLIKKLQALHLDHDGVFGKK